MSDSINATAVAVNKALSRRGEPYNGYSSKLVSWDDVSRGTLGSCWGANVTDTYLKTIGGDALFTVRPDNWNEKLGVVRSSDVALLTGNCDSGVRRPELRPITLEDFLRRPAQYGAAYTGISPDVSLAKEDLDDRVSIRFQTVFLPLPDASPGKIPRVQFAAEAYNYNTTSDDNPRNLILLASSQGIAVQADGIGAKRVLHCAREAETGPAKQFWLEAEATRFKVGYAQVETRSERKVAEARGKATSEYVGIRAMGKRFNALLTVQIPLAKRSGSRRVKHKTMPVHGRKQLATKAARSASGIQKENCRGRGGVRGRGRGRSSAARVSRGDSAGDITELPVKRPVRHSKEHITVTVVLYHCVQGGVPENADVVSAIEELERFYRACSDSGRLADAKFEFTTEPLSVKDVLDIYTKISTQPRPQV